MKIKNSAKNCQKMLLNDKNVNKCEKCHKMINENKEEKSKSVKKG